jgi:hypothetical protein
MPQNGFFLPVHSGHSINVKSVSHLYNYKESRSLDNVKALTRGDHTVQTVKVKIQREQKWTRKSAISIRAAEIAGTILSSMVPAIRNVVDDEPQGGRKFYRSGGHFFAYL